MHVTDMHYARWYSDSVNNVVWPIKTNNTRYMLYQCNREAPHQQRKFCLCSWHAILQLYYNTNCIIIIIIKCVACSLMLFFFLCLFYLYLLVIVFSCYHAVWWNKAIYIQHKKTIGYTLTNAINDYTLYEL